MLQGQRRTKGPLIPTKTTNGRSSSEKVFVKHEMVFEASKTAVKRTSKGTRIIVFVLGATYSENAIVKQFDSSTIDSVFLDPKLLERKVAMAKTATD